MNNQKQFNKSVQKNDYRHNFFPIHQDFETVDKESSYVVIGCCWCGQIRKIYADGRVKITVHKGIIQYEV